MLTATAITISLLWATALTAIPFAAFYEGR